MDRCVQCSSGINLQYSCSGKVKKKISLMAHSVIAVFVSDYPERNMCISKLHSAGHISSSGSHSYVHSCLALCVWWWYLVGKSAFAQSSQWLCHFRQCSLSVTTLYVICCSVCEFYDNVYLIFFRLLVRQYIHKFADLFNIFYIFLWTKLFITIWMYSFTIKFYHLTKTWTKYYKVLLLKLCLM